MNILFLTHYFHPHIGGVEGHSLQIALNLIKKGHKVTVITENFSDKLKQKEIYKGIKIIRFSYPSIKFLGLLYIWYFFWKNKKLIASSDIIHCHDVFVWYLPFRFLFPNKKVFTTFHGWEGEWPIPYKNIFLKKLAAKLSSGAITVGSYIGKYYGVNSDIITYGATNTKSQKYKKIKNKVVFVGRLSKDTGVLEFIKDIKKHKKWYVEFVGDGELREQCEKYGKVYGFTDPTPFLKTAEYAAPGGYLSYIEAKAYGCKIIVYPDNPLKKDYWAGIQKQETFPTWGQLTNEYIGLYKFSN